VSKSHKKEASSFKSLYPGYEEVQRILGKSKNETVPVAPLSLGIPFTDLLDDVMPGIERAAQVKRWKEVTGDLYTVGRAEAYVLHDQSLVKVARMSWDSGLEKEQRKIQKAVEPCASAARPDVPLRKLLPSLLSGDRQWSRWLKDYNEKMGTKHATVDVSVSAEEADKARERIPAMNIQAKKTGQEAGGKAGLKKPEAKKKQRPKYE
jgi:hypothetical protein